MKGATLFNNVWGMLNTLHASTLRMERKPLAGHKCLLGLYNDSKSPLTHLHLFLPASLGNNPYRPFAPTPVSAFAGKACENKSRLS